jgi:hypothetical protein
MSAYRLHRQGRGRERALKGIANKPTGALHTALLMAVACLMRSSRLPERSVSGPG